MNLPAFDGTAPTPYSIDHRILIYAVLRIANSLVLDTKRRSI